MNNPNRPESIEDVERIAAQAGITLTPEDYHAAYTLAEQRRQQMEAQAAAETLRGTALWVDRFNRIYPRFLKTLEGVGEVLITATQTLLIAFGVPGALLILLIVEQQRVQHGIDLFEQHAMLSFLGAFALVSLNLILELLISYVENLAQWTEPQENEFSFRLWSQRIGYMFGRNTDWKPRPKSPALRFRRVLRIVTFSILTLAVAGSMDTVIRSTKGDWLTALRSILFQSSLEQAVTWAGGLMFAVAVVFSAQALAKYVSQKVIEVLAIMQSNIEDKPRQIAAATGLTSAMYLYGKVKENQRARRAVSAVPLSVPVQEGTLRLSDFSSEPVPSVPERTETVSPKVQQALDWLEENPDNGLSVRKQATAAGVSPTVMQRAIERAKR